MSMNDGAVTVLGVVAVVILAIILACAGFPILVSVTISNFVFGLPIAIAVYNDNKRSIKNEIKVDSQPKEAENQLMVKNEERLQQKSEEEKRKAYHYEVQENLRQMKEKAEEDRLDAIADAALEYAQTKEKLKEQLKGHTKEEIAGIPKGVKMLDGLPYDGGYQGKFGVFSVYTTKDGKCYHAVKGCCGANIDTNLIKAIEYGRYPCKKCARGYPTKLPDWYIKYKIIEKYNL